MGPDGAGVRFVLSVRIAPGREAEFLERYAALGRRIERGLAGHVAHELCQSLDEPDRWLIASRWESIEASEAWERTPEHRELTLRLRECFAESERSAYAVRVDTRRKEEG
jgi:heme-degrading monooxygenase HmoA